MMKKKSCSCFAAMMMTWLAVLFLICTAPVGVHGQPTTKGFISIDCGIASNHNYVDQTTGIPYTSDDQFIDTGKNYNISANSISSFFPTQALTLRSFPDGARNCYTLKPIVQNQKYLLRASFVYGNYDGENSASADKPLQFDLHLGANLGQTISISGPEVVEVAEAFADATADFLDVCLVNAGGNTPPSRNSLLSQCRYPDDPYDRLWVPLLSPRFRTISTSSPIRYANDDQFEAPSAVLQTAATPANGTSLGIKWFDKTGEANFYFVMYFTEVEVLPSNTTRAFDVYLNGVLLISALQPFYLLSNYAYTVDPISVSTEYTVTLNATTKSTLLPILNALEVYTSMQVTQAATDVNDGTILNVNLLEFR
ncbi:senescence-induced receptor-like serine/threonine-protein kinase [Canna indica]|uniref:Senescence-induced receptor-like serine/threonine-protein kinase n=1 Tax=Canna indica TaxID=4628 RepID=A0AAQ3QNJ5_9LILI|nr:senescence-induced receptor-like serine/threonine-protein kinase [Canna indica]